MNDTFEDLEKHVGHDIQCVTYRDAVVFKCVTCNEFLVSIIPNHTLKLVPPDVISDVWGIVDVIERAKERDINLSKQQAREILHLIDKGKDAGRGINWDVLDTVTNDYLTKISGG
jgi:hypothetical protein